MNLLKEYRVKKGFSQLTLAKLTNIAPSDISRIENGSNSQSLKVAFGKVSGNKIGTSVA